MLYNDILIASNGKFGIEKVKAELNIEFDMKNLGVVRKKLVIEMIRLCNFYVFRYTPSVQNVWEH